MTRSSASAARRKKHPHVAKATAYREAVLSGEVPVSWQVRKACERDREDLARAGTDAFPFIFDPEEAERVCSFVEALPHIKGQWAVRHELIKLESWQCFLTCALFGWVHRDTGKRRFRQALVLLPRKNGKALALDTLLPTPGGWTTMGAVNVGDTLFDEQGNPTRVAWISDVATGRPCYRVTFSNGESVVADAEHQWLTTARVDRPDVGVGGHPHGKVKGKSVTTRVRTTQELADTLRAGSRGDRNHSVSMPGALDGPDTPLPVAPYNLGAWLGDGTSRTAELTCGEQDVAHFVAAIAADGYIVEPAYYQPAWRLRLRACDQTGNLLEAGAPIPVPHRTPNTLRKVLQALGVLGNKHIPDVYLRASRSQRIALLQGLMDTDGTVCARGKVFQYVTVSAPLSRGVGELLASLGVKYSVRECPLRCNGRPVEGIGYSLQFNAFRDALPVFRLPRKLARMRNGADCTVSPRSRSVQIAAVDPVPPVPVKCIGVDAPSRLFRFGRTMLPTHNSIWAAAVGLYMLAADGEVGAEVYCGATTEKQAWMVFEPAKRMVEKTPSIQKHMGVAANARNLSVLSTGSKFEPVIGDPGDGGNVHLGIVDEYHEHTDDRMVDTFRTGMASREQPLLLVITTAGVDTASPCAAMQQDVENILKGVYRDETTFGLVYTIDPEDDWTTEGALVKANPNWGVSKLPEIVLAEQAAAVRDARKAAIFQTKHLNVWCGARTPYFNLEAWQRAADPGLRPEDFAGEDCFVGVDLASKVDMAATVLLFRRDTGGAAHYYAFAQHYLPEETAGDPGKQHYLKWAAEGHLTVTDGNIIDQDVIERDLLDAQGLYGIRELGYDPWGGTQLGLRLVAEGVPAVEVPMTTRNLSEPMKWVEAMILAGRLHHNGDPVLAWMLANVTAKVDANENVFPRKERVENKIDGAVALILAMGRAMANADGASVYESRGVLYL